jgi:ABC-type lipoprotein release transport system permease subunit
MRSRQLIRRSLTHYWRTNLAVVLGVATAVAVLAGALLVGDSVRGSLRGLVVERLGRTDRVVVSSGFFRETLADDLRKDQATMSPPPAFCPMIVVEGIVSGQESGRRTSQVLVYGVDERFWRFHGRSEAWWPERSDIREALVSRALASAVGAAAGDAVLLRVERPSAIPLESLHGRKEDAGRTMRLTVRAVVGPSELGEFSLRPQQSGVQAVFVPLKRLQDELDLDGRVNTLLVSGLDHAALQEVVRSRATLEDMGLKLRPLASAVVLESATGLLDPSRAAAATQAAEAAGMRTQAVFTYLANSLKIGDREIPYSLITATDLPVSRSTREKPIVLNDWAARDLGARVGDPLTIEYYLWEEPGRLLTRTADFEVAGIVPMVGFAADRDFAPVYPGITESDTLADWDPPFPIDLRRVRRVDEEYWSKFRTTPKAFVPFEVGQALWQSRWGDRTSTRVVPAEGRSVAGALDDYGRRLQGLVDPLAAGLVVQDVRADGLTASRGATDFGAYFTYFSFFLVVSALLLAALFFRLGVEQRAREVGLLRSVGYSTARVRRLFALEGGLLAAIGSLVGAAAAIGYAAIMMAGLGSWWSGAVGTDALRLHVTFGSIAAGVVAAFLVAVACIWWTLRGFSRISERALLAGTITGADVAGGSAKTRRAPAVGAAIFGLLGAALMAASAVNLIDRAAAFFGAGSALLVAGLCVVTFNLRRPVHRSLDGHGWWAVTRLGLRNAADRPGRSVLVIAVIAAATFILISVEAFRRSGPDATDRRSGVGGYPVMVELSLPLAHDPNGREGRELLGLDALADATIEPLRLLPGDDASCLNLYEPTRPRVLGVSNRFVESGRFAFQSSLAATDAERRNPWLLLNREMPGQDGPVVPVIADANSMTYVLHKALGDDIVLNQGGRRVRLRLVAALADSIFQSELLMSEAHFLSLFPDQSGYQVLLVDAAPRAAPEIAKAVDEGGRDLGARARLTSERLAEFHRVENTYISTFQMLGGLGLLVGTVGLAAVLLRNALERRRDLALLGAVGFRRGHVFTIVLGENVLLLICGVALGGICALIAVVPAIVERGGAPMTASGSLLLVTVFVAGLLSSILATRAALGSPLVSALRAD